MSGCINGLRPPPRGQHRHSGDRQGGASRPTSSCLEGHRATTQAWARSLAEHSSEGEIVDAVDTVLKTYLTVREHADERFIDCYRRVGMKPFKEALYGADS